MPLINSLMASVGIPQPTSLILAGSEKGDLEITAVIFSSPSTEAVVLVALDVQLAGSI